MAPLQKRALYGLIFGIAWAVAIIVVFIMRGGVNAFNEDVGFRLIVDGLWIGGLVVYLVLFRTIIGKRGKFDERDKLILDRAPRVQWMAVIVALVVWMITLSDGQCRVCCFHELELARNLQVSDHCNVQKHH